MKSFRAVALAAVMSILLFNFGCEKPKPDDKVVQEPPPAEKESFPREAIPDSPTPPPGGVAPAPEPGPAEPSVTTIKPEPAPPTAHKAPRSTSQKPKEKYGTAKKSSGRTYEVKKGDTLQEISQKFYGTTTRWRRIANANKGINPNKLPVGAKLDIP